METSILPNYLGHESNNVLMHGWCGIRQSIIDHGIFLDCWNQAILGFGNWPLTHWLGINYLLTTTIKEMKTSFCTHLKMQNTPSIKRNIAKDPTHPRVQKQATNKITLNLLIIKYDKQTMNFKVWKQENNEDPIIQRQKSQFSSFSPS